MEYGHAPSDLIAWGLDTIFNGQQTLLFGWFCKRERQSCLLRISCFYPARKSSLSHKILLVQVAELTKAPSLPPPPPTPAYNLLYKSRLLCSHLVWSHAVLKLFFFAFVLFYFVVVFLCLPLHMIPLLLLCIK